MKPCYLRPSLRRFCMPVLLHDAYVSLCCTYISNKAIGCVLRFTRPIARCGAYLPCGVVHQHTIYCTTRSQLLTTARLPLTNNIRLFHSARTVQGNPVGLRERLAGAMGDALFTKLTLPNGVSYEQPLGLFIDNEFVKPTKGEERIEVLDPSSVTPNPLPLNHFTHSLTHP